MFFTVRRYGYTIFQNVKPTLENHIAKNITLVLTLSLISIETPNLHSVISSGTSTVSIANIIAKRNKVDINSCFI